MSRRLKVIAAVVAGTVLLAWLLPVSRAALTGAATLAEVLELPRWRPFAPTVSVHEAPVADHPADVYVGDGDAPVVILVPGAVTEGRDDPRVERLGRSMARAGRQVVVPELRVYDEQLVDEDVAQLVDMVLELSADDRDVVFVGISFGGSLALVAAADPRLDGRVAGVATFGAYADLLGVVQAATTGSSVVDGRTIPWEDPDPRAEQVVREQLTSFLPPASGRAVLTALEAGEPDVGFTPAARAVYRLLANQDPERTHPLARDLPVEILARVDAVSPAAAGDGLSDVPVVAMHSRTDPVIPYGELLRLGLVVPHAALLSVDDLGHSDLRITAPGGWLAALDDASTMWSFASRVLRWQEPTWPWQPG